MPKEFNLVDEENRQKDLIAVWTDDPAKAYANLARMVEKGFEKNFLKDDERDEKTETAFEDVMTELGALGQDFEKYQIQNEADKKTMNTALETHEKMGHKKKKRKLGKSDWLMLISAIAVLISGGSGIGITQM